MNFFEEQSKAKKKTWFLVALYIVCLFTIVSILYLTVFFLFNYGSQIDTKNGNFNFSSPNEIFDLNLFIAVCVVTLSIIGLGTIIKLISLLNGGSAVAEGLGGVLISPDTSDPLERRLLNIVEEMSISSGVPVPKVYVLKDEQGINAFAAGEKIDDAVIGVTRSCMTLLTRDELQGVIAHEFSHILNGDMRLNIRLIGILAGLLLLSQIGYWTFRLSSFGRRGRSRGGKGGDARAQIAIIVLGVVVMILGYIGVFFSRIIKSAISRQREYLADASAVQFTRNPDGIAGALKKIGAISEGSYLVSDKAEESSHLFFATGLSFSSLLATHPPLKERIKMIDPNFSGEFPEITTEDIQKITEKNKLSQAKKADSKKSDKGFKMPGMDAIQDSLGNNVLLAAGFSGSNGSTQDIFESIGNPSSAHLEYATLLRENLPERIVSASHDLSDSRALVYSLLIVSSSSDIKKQLDYILQNAEKEVCDVINEILSYVKELDLKYRLPLLEMCVPSLKLLSEQQKKSFMDNIFYLVKFDESVSLFEYVLSRIITNRIILEKNKKHKITFDSIHSCERECVELVAVLSRYGSSDPKLQEKAFASGISKLEISSNPSLTSVSSISFKRLDSILVSLKKSSYEIREKISKSCLETLLADGRVTIEESELFRAINDSLEIPVPPVLVNS